METLFQISDTLSLVLVQTVFAVPFSSFCFILATTGLKIEKIGSCWKKNKNKNKKLSLGWSNQGIANKESRLKGKHLLMNKGSWQ